MTEIFHQNPLCGIAALDALGKTFRLFWNEKTCFCNVLIGLLNPIKAELALPSDINNNMPSICNDKIVLGEYI